MATHSAVERTSFLSEAGKTVGLKSKCPKSHCTSPEFLQHPWYHLILSRVLWPGQRHWEGCASQNVPRSKPWIISCSLFEHIWWHFEWLFKRFCKKAIIRFSTLLWCLAFDLKRFVAFCFFFIWFFSPSWGMLRQWTPLATWHVPFRAEQLSQRKSWMLPGAVRRWTAGMGAAGLEAFFHPPKSVDFGRVPVFEHKREV